MRNRLLIKNRRVLFLKKPNDILHKKSYLLNRQFTSCILSQQNLAVESIDFLFEPLVIAGRLF